VFSPDLLDGRLGSAGGVGWSHHYISGCTSATLTQQRPSASGSAAADAGSTSQGAALLQREPSLAAQPLLLSAQPSGADLPTLLQQQQQLGLLGGDELALPGWGMRDYSLPFSSAYSDWPGAGGAAVGQLDAAGAGLGSGEYGLGLPYYSLDQLPGDAGKLSEVVAAAAALGTPPLPPRGSRFDDMDSFSSSSAGLSMAANAPLLPGTAAARQQQQQGGHRQGRQHERQVVLTNGRVVVAQGGSSRSRGSSGGHLSPAAWSLGQQLVAADGASDGAAAAAVVAEHLDGLLSGLSLLGERAPADVAQELAVAHSVHQVRGGGGA
jgi:hypothetical protein